MPLYEKSMPRMGQGTWRMGDNPKKRQEEIAALQEGIRLGLSLIDTAEMYGDGRSETLVGEALRGLDRDSVYLVSKVYPHNADKKHIYASCEASLSRLNVSALDLYLLHWRGGVRLSETVSCMEDLKRQGKNPHWGVSNFDTADMEELWTIPGGQECAVNQVLYHLGSRGIEYSLMPWMKAHQVKLMAYCPLAQQSLVRRELYESGIVLQVAARYNITPAQVLLGFLLSDPLAIPIPKSGSIAHVQENAAMLNISLSKEDLDMLREAFPAPNHKTPLDVE